MRYRYLFLLSIFITFYSCSKNEIALPPYNPDINLENTIPISDSIMRNMEGIYNLDFGSPKLGGNFVCKVSFLFVRLMK